MGAVRIRNLALQAAVLAAFLLLAWFAVDNMLTNLARANIGTGFGFLFQVAGFEVSQSLIPYDQMRSTYGHVYLVGLVNTLVVSVSGIVVATCIGFAVGIARLSGNWLIRTLAAVYIEALRNVPLLLQIFIWYFAVLRLLPQRRDSLDLGPLGMVNISGWYAPRPVFGEQALQVAMSTGCAILLALVLILLARRHQRLTGRRLPAVAVAVPMVVGTAIAAFHLSGQPLSFEYPAVGRFGPRGGLRFYPELIGLVLALSTYTAAYIAEVVRAGILAVDRGQSEAARALGLRHTATMRLIIIPQAMRVIIPPLTNQYLNLTKNSSLAVAIAYPDLVSVFAGTALNQTGQAAEILLMTMLTYLTLSLLTALAMNAYNARHALRER